MVQICTENNNNNKKKPTKQIRFKTSEYARAHIVLWAVFLSSFFCFFLVTLAELSKKKKKKQNKINLELEQNV